MRNKKEPQTTTSQNRIGAGTKLVGDISSSSGFRLDGSIEGTLTSEGKVVIGKDGLVNGSLICGNADVEGKVMGKLQVTGTLTLKSTAHIEGEVVVSKLAVEPGATFNATCVMKDNVKKLDGKKDKSA